MTKRTFFLVHTEARQRAAECVKTAPDGYSVTVQPPKRTNAQNAAMWPILEAFSAQLQWPVNGRMVYMTPEEWKDVLTAGFRQETTRLAMGLDGGVVMLGSRTSEMLKPEFVSPAMAYLASDESGLMTGSNIDFDQTILGAHN